MRKFDLRIKKDDPAFLGIVAIANHDHDTFPEHVKLSCCFVDDFGWPPNPCHAEFLELMRGYDVEVPDGFFYSHMDESSDACFETLKTDPVTIRDMVLMARLGHWRWPPPWKTGVWPEGWEVVRSGPDDEEIDWIEPDDWYARLERAIAAAFRWLGGVFERLFRR